MNFKKVSLIILLIIICLIIGTVVFRNGDIKVADKEKIQVVASNFASYDFIRAIIGDTDNIELTYLLGPGKDAHSYDPTAQDLITIQNADLFIYVGGTMEKWVDKVLNAGQDYDMKKICVADYVDVIKEQEVDGAEKEDEEEAEGAFDEHIWTSPKNAISMINIFEEEIEKLDNNNASIYQANAEKYISQIKNVDSQIQEIVDNKVRDRLIFADKMPMQYFMNYYNLKVSAAFSGCSTETEPSASTIAYLEKKIKEENIPVVLYIELNDGKVAKTIADETECQALQIQTLHNISKDDFENGETWVSLMTRNIDVLRKALQ
jgi:zinc transport system substrate-binding protein